MKIFFTFIIALFLSAVSALAQYQPNIIFWTSEAECGSKKLVIERTVVCREFDENGSIVKVIENGQIAVSLKLIDERTRWVASIHIANNSAEKIELDLNAWKLVHYSNENEFLARAEPLATGNAFIVVERNTPIATDQGPAAIGMVDIWRPGEFRNADLVRQSSRTEPIPGINPPPKPDPRNTVIPQAPGMSKSDPTATTTSASDGGPTGGVGTVSAKNTRSTKSIFNSKQFSAKNVNGKKTVSGSFYFRSAPGSSFRLATLNIGDTTYVFQFQDN
ncbi:hypothetical protein [Leptolyngbya sp. 7M]|uniref:hypothetical protein n=1 Tax=Leptolyngbya sp. 7M TaxID=2812896 RepID=UPI001B8D4B01|nr:hypothetical protein [Leptolyngbya sp. 7M]QYO66564.1 hypothetical protein JVX88_07115 [Leptolyngbya sp. 7M]